MEEYFRNMKFRLAESNFISWNCIRSAFRDYEYMGLETNSRQETFYDNITRSNTEHGYMIKQVDPMDGSKPYYVFYSEMESDPNDPYVIEHVTRYESLKQLSDNEDDSFTDSLPIRFKVDISAESAVFKLNSSIRISLEKYCFDIAKSHPIGFIVVKDNKSCADLSGQGRKIDDSDFVCIKDIVEQNFGNIARLSFDNLSEIGFNLP